MKFAWAYPPAKFEEGKWYGSRNDRFRPMKVVKRNEKTIVMSDGRNTYRMKIRKGWNEHEYAFYYMWSEEDAYWATLASTREGQKGERK